jgi:NAD(P)-dependent dehydrogenase (short-subunit alcohol dehydrogenase family)
VLLQGKNAIIYGAGGSIGGAVAKAFAEAGARVFLTGRTKASLDAVAAPLGLTDVDVVDALDEHAVDAHAESVVARAGSIDISFNLVTRGDVQGIPLVDMTTADFLRPITNGMTAAFVTARAAARVMVRQGGGVILALDSRSAGGSPMMGGTGPADGALDSFVRNLALETGPSGVRVVGIYTAGLPETLSPEKLAAVNPNLNLDEAAFQGLLAHLDQMRMLKRSPTLAQVAATATFLASDQAAAITGTFLDATSGIP